MEEANSGTENILDLIPGIFFIINEEDEVLRGNFEFAKLLGCEYEDMFRKNIASLFHPQTWEMFNHHLDNLRRNDQEKEKFELGIIDPVDPYIEKSYYWLMTTLKTKNKTEGTLITVIGEDISELRESEKKIDRNICYHSIGYFYC